MNIAIIGAGSIGRALAQKWTAAGHQVVFGRRQIAEEMAEAASVSIDAALSRDVIVLAIPGDSVDGFLIEQSGALAGKLVIDATNSVGRTDMHHAAAAGEIEGLRYVRAFNTLGVENIINPRVDGVEFDMLFTAPATDRNVAEQLITDVGFRPIWLGEGEAAASTLDGLTRIWFALAIGQGRGRHLGFKVVS